MGRRAWLESTWRARFMERRKNGANGKVKRAIRLGHLPPVEQCLYVDCGKPAFCYEHRDYRKPLDVEPVCKSCDCMRGPAKPYHDPNSKTYKRLIKKFKKEEVAKLKALVFRGRHCAAPWLLSPQFRKKYMRGKYGCD